MSTSALVCRLIAGFCILALLGIATVLVGYYFGFLDGSTIGLYMSIISIFKSVHKFSEPFLSYLCS